MQKYATRGLEDIEGNVPRGRVIDQARAIQTRVDVAKSNSVAKRRAR